MTFPLVIGVALIGAAGAVARYVTDTAIKAAVRPGFPWATLLINIAGSFVLGLITGAVLFDGAPSELHVLAGVGFCSSYTTFSTAVFEAVALLRQNRWRAAVATAAGTIVATSAAAALGLGIAAL